MGRVASSNFTLLATLTGNNLNMASAWAQVTGSYSPTYTGRHLLYIRIGGDVGSGAGRIAPTGSEDYKLCITKDTAGYYQGPFDAVESLNSDSPLSVGAIKGKWFWTPSVMFRTGDTYYVWLKGGAADSAVDVTVEVYGEADFALVSHVDGAANASGEAWYTEDSEDYTSSTKNIATEQTVLTHTVTGRGRCLFCRPRIAMGTAAKPITDGRDYLFRVLVDNVERYRRKVRIEVTQRSVVLQPIWVLDGEAVKVNVTGVAADTDVGIYSYLDATTDYRQGRMLRNGQTVHFYGADDETVLFSRTITSTEATRV